MRFFERVLGARFGARAGTGAGAASGAGTGTRSGQSEMLVSHATGLPAALLDAAVADTATAGTPGHDGPASLPEAPEVARAAGRRGRGLDRADIVIADQIAGKILGFWLQNRHQTLFPLTVNLRTVAPAAARTLARFAAASLLAGAAGDEGERTHLRDWLEGAGADAPTLAAFTDALADPAALSTLLHEVSASTGLPAYAYVAALVALGQRDVTAQLFLEYLAARLALPTTVVRSANRRYRR